MSLTAHLAINDSGLNLIHEFRHNFGILIVSHVTRILDAIKHILELVFDSFQGTREDSTLDPTRGAEITDANGGASLRVDCSLRTASPSFVPKPSLSSNFNKVSIFSLVTDDSFRQVRRVLPRRDGNVPHAVTVTFQWKDCTTRYFVSPEAKGIGEQPHNQSPDFTEYRFFR